MTRVVDWTLPEPRRITAVLLAIVAILLLLHVIGPHVPALRPRPWGTPELLSLDGEGNLPTFFSSGLTLAACGLLAALRSVAKARDDPDTRAWTLLTVAFAWMAVDDAAQLHENADAPLRALMGTGGWLHHAWVVIGVAAVAIVLAGCSRLLLRLPRRDRGGFLLAGAIFVSGALGLEMVAGASLTDTGERTSGYKVAATAQEVLEMVGLVVFIHVLIALLRTRVDAIRIALPGGRARPGAGPG